jgi:radical SAM family uncharacterized protein/radical SAM-linked protein
LSWLFFFKEHDVKQNQLLDVEKPARYMGGEMGIIRKDAPEVRFALAFPDVYEVGMSHLGFQILYRILNACEWLAAERVYAPWPDREEQLRTADAPLTTLESGTPLRHADIIGFTLQHELSYTNILNMLDMSGIPLLAEERDGSWPLIVGGGPCAYNPEPLADFFDAFLLGDGEEAALEIAAAYRQWHNSGRDKSELLTDLERIGGVYIPSRYRVTYRDDGRIDRITPLTGDLTPVRRRFLSDLESAPYPDNPVIPFMKTVHDRVSMEIGRGCTRGCRFCQAGYIYRPVRERSPQTILETIDRTLKATGYDEVSLLSLATGDYGCLTPLLKELMQRYAESKIAISFPSLRVGTLTDELIEEVKKVRKTGLTLAPEAGSERLRRVINKGISEEALLADARTAYGAGWRLIKLYFMIGLPTETMDDINAIIDLGRRVKTEGRLCGNGGEVNVSVSSFVPKAHTPFQWEPQISYEEILTKQEYLRTELKRKKLNFKWHDAPLSVVEGVFARGDRRLGKVLLEAHRLGCRFDSWGDHFSFSAWQKAFAACAIDPRFYLRRRDTDELLPWDHLDSGVSKEFLLKERELALEGAPTPDCRTGACSACGVCDFKGVRMHTMQPEQAAAVPLASGDREDRGEPARVRIRFSKTGSMRYLSHLELITLFTRAVARGGVPIRFSQGFHPHPKFSFATALSVGVESRAEYLDMEIMAGFGAEAVKHALNAVLPAGMSVLEAWDIPMKSESLSMIMAGVRYRVTLAEGMTLPLEEMATGFLSLDHYPYQRAKKGGVQEFDLREGLQSVSAGNSTLELVIDRAKPLEYVAAITGLPLSELSDCRIEKLDVIFKDLPL